MEVLYRKIILMTDTGNLTNEEKSLVYDPNEPKFHKGWRPAVAWSYIVICMFDFIINPIFFALLQHHASGDLAINQWQPLTLTWQGRQDAMRTEGEPGHLPLPLLQ